MNTLNTSTARVVDPVLSTVAQGYTNAAHVGSTLFPRVEVMQHGGNVIEFGPEAFSKMSLRRAPGADAKTIQLGYEGKPYTLVGESLDALVPREHMQDASQVPGIDLGTRAINITMKILELQLEIEQSELASDPNSYAADNRLALTGGDKWDDPTSTPIADIEAAKDQVRAVCGIEPNRMVLANGGFKALKYHPTIREHFKYTTAESITAAMLANLLELDKLVVGKTTYIDENATGNEFTEAWGNNAILAYVPPQDLAIEQPAFGYTYTLKGHPFVEQPRWDGGKRSWVYGVSYDRKPVLTGMKSGFLFQNVVGA